MQWPAYCIVRVGLRTARAALTSASIIIIPYLHANVFSFGKISTDTAWFSFFHVVKLRDVFFVNPPRRRYLLAGGLSQTGESNAATRRSDPGFCKTMRRRDAYRASCATSPRRLKDHGYKPSATAPLGLERYLHSAPSSQRIFWISPLRRGARPGKNLLCVPIFIIIYSADSL